MTVRRVIVLAAAALVAVGWTWVFFLRSKVDWTGPAIFNKDIPSHCQQLVLVLSPERNSVPARMWLLERTAMSEQDMRQLLEWLDPDKHPHLAQAATE